MRVITRNLRLYGLLVFTLAAKYEDEFYEVMPALVKEGKIKFKEERTHGLDKVGQALLDVGTGANSGKVVIVVSDD